MTSYQQSFIRYWGRGFNYDRSHVIKNNVSIQTYKILMHYTEMHKNCRVGCYLSVRGFSEFFSLKQLIPAFDLFAEVAENDKKISPYPEFIQKLTGPTFQEEIENVWRLKYPIRFEFKSKSLWEDFFGYNFNKVMAIKIDPDEISALEGESLDSFRISMGQHVIDISFKNNITVSPVPSTLLT